MNPVKYIPLDCVYGTKIKIGQEDIIALIERVYFDSRKETLEEVKAIAAIYAESNPPRFIETPNRAEFNRGWESAGWNIYRDIELLKHKDGQP